MRELIDRWFPSPHAPLGAAGRRAVVMFVYAAVGLTLLEYIFRPEFFARQFPTLAAAHFGLYAHLWWAFGSILVYLPLPMLIVRLGFRQPVRDYGWRLTREPRHWLVYLVMVAAVLPLVVYAASRPDFRAVYPFYRGAMSASVTQVLTWEAAYLAQFVALEFFFRGFLAIGLAPAMGRLAVWAAAVPYCMLHFHKPLPEALASIVAGIVLGVVAQRTGSIVGGVLVHVTVALTMELLALGLL